MERTRTTRQKQLIMTVLHEAAVPLTAGEIYARCVRRQPNLAKSTVYRNLEAMHGRGEVSAGLLESGERFYAEAEPHTHKHYMICKGCNARLDLPACPMEELEKEIARRDGFTVTEHVIQLYGYCRDCAAKRREQSGTEVKK